MSLFYTLEQKMFTHYKSLSDAEELYSRFYITHHIRDENYQPVYKNTIPFGQNHSNLVSQQVKGWRSSSDWKEKCLFVYLIHYSDTEELHLVYHSTSHQRRTSPINYPLQLLLCSETLRFFFLRMKYNLWSLFYDFGPPKTYSGFVFS